MRLERGGVALDLWHDYQVFGVNWVEFTVVHLSVECEHITGCSELHAAILGLHLRLSWRHNRRQAQAFAEEMHARIDASLSQPDPDPEKTREIVSKAVQPQARLRQQTLAEAVRTTDQSWSWVVSDNGRRH